MDIFTYYYTNSFGANRS